ncbi:hypothetical protein [Exiguobacterium indicum]|uniref:hypothetical protein n=1 Tax=Exiguobacterium indicum TaxID=296995 RepID=UPI000AA1384E|nr:hypothetical protein [Exiguobacterium indicum]
MAKVIVEMEVDIEEFDTLTDEERFEAIETILESGAESNATYINVSSITIKDEK